MELSLHLHFLEPFRLLEWCEHEKRTRTNDRWQRGQSFARWHKEKDSLLGRPYITGTLLRSAVLRAVEEELARPDTPWQDCCGGEFFTEKGEKPQHQRHRSTIRKGNARKPCEKDDELCPLCLLLGRFDKAVKGKVEKEDYGKFNVRFANLDLAEHLSPRDFSGCAEIGTCRTINRVDDFTGKAHDFFSIWEIDQVRDFYGKIILADDREFASLDIQDNAFAVITACLDNGKVKALMPSDNLHPVLMPRGRAL